MRTSSVMAAHCRWVLSRRQFAEEVRTQALTPGRRGDGNIGHVRLVRREHEAAVPNHFSIDLEHDVVTGIPLGQFAREHAQRPGLGVRPALYAHDRRQVPPAHRLGR